MTGGIVHYLLAGFLFIQAIQVSSAAIENVSRGKNTTQSDKWRNGTSDKAVDGDYSTTDLDRCATLLSNRSTRSSPFYVTWKVNLGGLYAIVSVTIYNTAVVPEGTFTNGMSVCAIHRNDTYTRSQCKSIDYRYPLPLGGSVTVHFDQLVVANVISIRKAGLLTLCEVDVLGTNVALSPEEDASAGKAASQSGTVAGRLADYAVDGNINTTDLGHCASAFYYDELAFRSRAWWQLNLGDFYLVTAITVYFPTVRPDSLYTNTFNSFIAFNDSLLPGYLHNTYRGPGRCYRNLNTVPSSGVATLICARYPSRYRYSISIGRYVTVVPYSQSSWTSVLTICEINVVGVRQNISADDPAFAVFSPKPAAGNDSSIVFPLAVAAIVIAGLFAILCVVFIVIVIVKLKGRAKNGDANTPATNAYQEQHVSKNQKRKQKQIRRPSTPPLEEMYADTVNPADAGNDDDYEYVTETELGRNRGFPPMPSPRY